MIKLQIKNYNYENSEMGMQVRSKRATDCFPWLKGELLK